MSSYAQTMRHWWAYGSPVSPAEMAVLMPYEHAPAVVAAVAYHDKVHALWCAVRAAFDARDREAFKAAHAAFWEAVPEPEFGSETDRTAWDKLEEHRYTRGSHECSRSGRRVCDAARTIDIQTRREHYKAAHAFIVQLVTRRHAT